MQQQIRDWLNERGMAQYADAFAAQNVDLTILPDLTDQDLKELGVLLGDRRKILSWAAGLKRANVAFDLTDGATGPAQHQSNLGERRQVTVLFSDMVDSTALSRSIDPEDLRALIRSYQDAVTKAVARLDGLVAGFRGDGVLVYFGYPNAHEDDAERAVRAGLEMISAVRALPSANLLRIRVGIATGLVVVGDLIRSGDTQERDILGETPNLAARILGLAEPDTVVIADGTRRLLGDLYEFSDLGLRSIKGIAAPVRTWSVLQPRAVESRYEALHAAGHTALTGRDDELNLLTKRWSKAKGGEGQVVLISGEPGIGKSRLTAALMEEIASEPHARLRYFCSPQHTDSAFYPVINQMERGAGFAQGDSADVKLDKLDTVLSANSATEHDMSLIAALLSLPANRYPALDYDAAQRRAKTMETLHAQVVTLAARTTVLMILEDAHWIDPTSLETFGRFVEKLKGLNILLVITYRPEFNAPWIGDSHVTTLNLNRLDDGEASRIVASLAGNKPLSADVVADIVDRSDGVPLFIEEMTKAVLEAENETAARETVAAAPAQTHAVPASLHASLMSRLDRLGAAKGIAQVGAAIGRSFTHALLAAVANDDPDDLRIHLDRLIASGLLFRQGQPPNATYLFKHALIRDAAYSMLLREPRRALHARILEALETKFADIAESQPEILAHHATDAGQIEKAAGYWGKAGLRSLRHSATREALAQLTRAQEQFAALPSNSERLRSQIELQTYLATAVSQTHGYSALETKSAFERVKLLIDQAEAQGGSLDVSHGLFMALWGLWGVHLVNYNHHVERPLVIQLLELAEKHGDPLERAIAHQEMGKSHFFAGEFVQAPEYFRQALALYKSANLRSRLMEKVQDTSVDTSVNLGWTLGALGFPDAAKASVEMAVRNAREIAHMYTLMFALDGLGWYHIKWTDDYCAATASIDEQSKIAEEQGAPFWSVAALLKRGALLSIAGDPEAAISVLNSGIAAWRAMGATIAMPLFDSYLARAYARNGDFAEARKHYETAMRTVEETGERAYAVAPHFAAFEIELMAPEPDFAKAENYANRALATAKELNAKGWELRVALALARLWRDQGKTREAYELLSPVYNWFTEGFEWKDMQQAKALLDELK